ncbi:MAG: amino acid deaminase/aldolase [Chloroflexota bacterium]
MKQRYQQYKTGVSRIPLPLPFVDMDLLDENIAQVLARSDGKRVRVASKSVRSVAVLRHILASDARFQGLMCFTAPEAVWLAAQGFDDLLTAYPAWEPRHITAVCQAIRQGSHITLMVDSEAHIRHIEAIAQQEGVVVPLCLDLDMSSDYGPIHFGVWRSGVRMGETAVSLAHLIAQSPHLKLDGVMGYEAQIAGLGDANPEQKVMSRLIRLLKGRSIPQVARRRAGILAELAAAGLTLRFVNGGGTGSLHTTSRETAVTEVTAGSAFFAPLLFDHYHDFRFQPAAGYAIQIVRQPKPGLYTCLGGGYPASGQTGPDKSPQPYLPVGARLDGNEGAGEVQTPIHYTGPEKLALGDPIFMRHAKAGELCERFNALLLLRNGRLLDEVTTYRGDGQCFL